MSKKNVKTAAAISKATRTVISASDAAAIAAAKKFQIKILLGAGKFKSAYRPNLAAARAMAKVLTAEANNGRIAMVHAIDAKDNAVLVPADYVVAAPVAALKKVVDTAIAKGAPIVTEIAPKAAAAKAKPAPKKTAKAKPAKAAKAKPAKKAKAEKKPRAPKAGSKSEIVVKMLSGKGATRKDIVAAVDGWNVDLKALCARKNLKLNKSKDGIYSATAAK